MKKTLLSLLLGVSSTTVLARHFADCNLITYKEEARTYHPFPVNFENSDGFNDRSLVEVALNDSEKISLYFMQLNDSNAYDVTVGISSIDNYEGVGGRTTYYQESEERSYETFFWHKGFDSIGLLCTVKAGS